LPKKHYQKIKGGEVECPSIIVARVVIGCATTRKGNGLRAGDFIVINVVINALAVVIIFYRTLLPILLVELGVGSVWKMRRKKWSRSSGTEYEKCLENLNSMGLIFEKQPYRVEEVKTDDQT